MTGEWSFVVEGPLLGYRASIRRAFDPKYRAFKDRVRLLALEAGVPIHKLDPKAKRVELSVWVYWHKTPRIDWSNVYKAVEDSLWGQDRYIHPGHNGFVYCSNGKPYNDEAARVTITSREL